MKSTSSQSFHTRTFCIEQSKFVDGAKATENSQLIQDLHT